MANIESSLSSTEIQRIHSKKTAVRDRLYTDEGGTRYLGLADGRLQRIEDIKGDVTGDLETSVISNINDRTPVVLTGQVDANTVAIAALDLAKLDRCEGIAFNIAFG